MDAVIMRGFGGPEVLEAADLEIPDPGPGQVRVRVESVIVNTTRDVTTRTGTGAFSHFVSLPHVLGGEHAGRVDAVGQGVDRAWLSRRVAVNAAISCGACEHCLAGEDQACSGLELIGVHRRGAYAEFAIAPAENLYELPDGLPAVDAVVLLATGGVGLAQVEAAGVPPGGVLVVPGVSGALGSMVALLATDRGCRVIGVTRAPERARTLPLAAEAVVDASQPGLEDRLRAACGPGGAHAIVDNVCVPQIWDACLPVLRPRGRVVISGTFESGNVTINTRRLYVLNQTILGVRTGNAATTRAFWELVHGGLRPPGDLVQTFALHEAAAVHRRIEAGAKHGHYALVTASAETAPPASADGRLRVGPSTPSAAQPSAPTR